MAFNTMKLHMVVGTRDCKRKQSSVDVMKIVYVTVK
jgi:hypothetical protein